MSRGSIARGQDKTWFVNRQFKTFDWVFNPQVWGSLDRQVTPMVVSRALQELILRYVRWMTELTKLKSVRSSDHPVPNPPVRAVVDLPY